jgi:hypothetical protein
MIRSLLALAAFAVPLSTPAASHAADAHPAAETARAYVKTLLARDWQGCSAMIQREALERKLQSTVALVRGSATVTEETEKLRSLGLSSLKELEALTPRAFFVREREMMEKALGRPATVPQEELRSLTMEVLSVGAEEDGAFVHVLLRTHRDTSAGKVHELMLVSLHQDSSDKTKWHVVPDSLMPVFEAVNGAAGAGKAR